MDRRHGLAGFGRGVPRAPKTTRSYPDVHHPGNWWRTSRVASRSRRDLSRRVGLVPQSEPVAFEPSEHDAFPRNLVDRRLAPTDGKYLWPRGVRSALVHGEVTEPQARG